MDSTRHVIALGFPARDEGIPQDGARKLVGVEACAGGGPVLGRKLEVAVAGPVRQDADDLGEVCLGVESVQLTRSDELEEIRGGLGVVVRAEEEPRFSPTANGPKGGCPQACPNTRSPNL